MPPKKRKNPSFDAMVKLFIQKYDIPTKKDVPGRKDIERLHARLDRLEDIILKASKSSSKVVTGKPLSCKNSVTASDIVLDIVEKSSEKGVGFAEIQNKTGFEKKKLRNIIFRLNVTGKIKRKSRGVYIVPGSA